MATRTTSSNSVSEESFFVEVDACLRDWIGRMQWCLMRNQQEEYRQLRNQISALKYWRALLAQTPTNPFLKGHVFKLLEARREMDDTSNMPRKEGGEYANEFNTSATELFQLHQQLQKRAMDGVKLPTSILSQYISELQEGIHRDEVKGTQQQSTVEGRCSIWMRMNMAMFSAGEPVRLLFRIWNSKRGDLSEEFLVSLTSQGMPEEASLMDKLHTVFNNLEKSDMQEDCYIVCKIVRIGKLNYEPETKQKTGFFGGSKQTSNVPTYCRPFACGLLNLSSVKQGTADYGKVQSQMMKIYQPSGGNESSFPNVHEILSRNEMSLVEEVPRSNGIAFELSLVETGYKSSSSDMVPDFLRLNTDTVKITDRLSLPNTIDPRFRRNEVFITICNAEFSQGGKTTAMNVEVRLRCLTEDGEPINCITQGTGDQANLSNEYRSCVYYHANNPTYNETAKVIIPEIGGLFERSHIQVLCFHCSNNKDSRTPFCFSYFPLSRAADGTCIADAQELRLSCYDPLSSMGEASIGRDSVSYLRDQKNLKPRTYRSGMTQVEEFMLLKINVCSTVKAQAREMHCLFSWKSSPDVQLPSILKGCSRMENAHIIRYIRLVLDNLCEIMTARQQLRVEAFSAFSYVLKALSKDAAASAMLDVYISSAFSNDRLYSVLIDCLDDVFGWIPESVNEGVTPLARAPSNLSEKSMSSDDIESKEVDIPNPITGGAAFTPPTSPRMTVAQSVSGISRSSSTTPVGGVADRKQMADTIDALPTIFKIVKLSWELATRNTAMNKAAALDRVRILLRTFLNRVNAMMTIQETVYKMLQGRMLKSFYVIVNQLGFAFSFEERAAIVRKFLGTFPTENREKNQTNKEKLDLVAKVTRSELFQNETAKCSLIGTFVHVFSQHLLFTPDDCILALSDLINNIQDCKRMGPVAPSVISDVSYLLHPLALLLLSLINKSADRDLADSEATVKTAADDEAGGAGMLKGKKKSGLSSPTPQRHRNNVRQGETGALLQSCCAAFCGLISILDEGNFVSLLASRSDGAGKRIVMNCLICCRRLLQFRIFPTVWQLMVRLLYRSSVTLLGWVNSLLRNNFAPKLDPGMLVDKHVFEDERTDSELFFKEDCYDFDRFDSIDDDNEQQTAIKVPDKESWVYTSAHKLPFFSQYCPQDAVVWAAYFDLALWMVGDVHIINILAQLPVEENDQDMRLCVLSNINDCWSALKENQIVLVNQMVQHLLELVNSTYLDSSAMGKSMYLDLLRADNIAFGNFVRVGRHTIDSVDRIVNEEVSKVAELALEDQGTALQTQPGLSAKNQLYSLFETELLELMATDPVLNTSEALLFAREVKELFSLLRALSQFAKTKEFEEERGFAFGRLMDFLLKMNRIESYVKYAFDLSRELVSLSLFTEAAASLLQYARQLQWSKVSSTFVDLGDAEAALSISTESERKEAIYRRAIALYDQGQFFEGSCDLWQELAGHYFSVHAYQKLTLTHTQLAGLYEKIRTTDRYYPSYFRVGYFGQGFPEDIRNKEFVYRGDSLESIIDFTNRVKAKFPRARQLSPKEVPVGNAEFLNSPDTAIQISKMIPASEEEMNGVPVDTSDMPTFVKQFRTNNNINVFYYQRPFRKRSEKSANEFLDLWVEKIYVKTADWFPCCRRRSKVIDRAIVVLNPIEMAVSGLQEKNLDLKEKVTTLRNCVDRKADQSLTMAFYGTVDAAVNGGTKNYITFINGEYRRDNPEIAEDIDSFEWKQRFLVDIRRLLDDQLVILESAIPIHGFKCIEAMVPLHEHMVTKYAQMKKETKDMLGGSPALEFGRKNSADDIMNGSPLKKQMSKARTVSFIDTPVTPTTPVSAVKRNMSGSLPSLNGV